MSGLEILPIVFGGISAATGAFNTARSLKKDKTDAKTGSQVSAPRFENHLETFAFTNGMAEAFSNSEGSSARSSTGGTATAWSKSSYSGPSKK